MQGTAYETIRGLINTHNYQSVAFDATEPNEIESCRLPLLKVLHSSPTIRDQMRKDVRQQHVFFKDESTFLLSIVRTCVSLPVCLSVCL